MDQLRETVGDLRTPPTRVPTLQSIVDGVTGIDVELIQEGNATVGDDPAEAAIRAAVREALTNVVRHSDASKARVTVRRGPELISVQVCDDGKGGDFVEGHGIRGMRERAASLGGHVDTSSSPEGFTVEVVIPR